MIKLFFLTVFLLMGSHSLKAAQELGDDQAFKSELDNIKNPFESGLPKPVEIINKPIYPEQPKPMVFSQPKPQAVFSAVITPPQLKLQGVIVGEGIHQAIINEQVVPLGGGIKGARVVSVTKQGVELLFKGKKFFLKVD